MVLIETERTVLNAQETLVIRCVYREAKFAGWTKDGVQLSANLDQRLNVSQTHALTVFNLTVNDSGVYSCLSEMPRGNASVQITVRGESVEDRTTYRPHTDHIPTTYRPHTDHVTDHILTTHRPRTDHIPTTLTTTYRRPTDHVPITYRPRTDNIPTTYRSHTDHFTDHIPTTYRPRNRPRSPNLSKKNVLVM